MQRYRFISAWIFHFSNSYTRNFVFLHDRILTRVLSRLRQTTRLRAEFCHCALYPLCIVHRRETQKLYCRCKINPKCMVIHTPRNIVYIRVLQSAIVYLPPSTKPALTLTNSYTTSFVFKIFQHIANKSPIEQLLTKI